MIYLICTSDETYGIETVCYYTEKRSAQDLLQFIESVRLEREAKLSGLRQTYITGGKVHDAEYTRRYKEIQAEASRHVKSVHPKLEVYYTYIIVEVEPGKVLGSIQ